MINQTILARCRVLDLTDEKGLFCGQLLSGMGAEVIRLRKPGAPAGPQPEYGNTGIHCLNLNLEDPRGRALFERIVRTSDVLIESFPPGFMASLGLDYPALCQSNPALIVASISAFGQSGPWQNYKTSDLISAALGGQMSVCGEPGRPPLKPYGSQAFSTACLFAANGILLALWQRRTSGQSRYLDISIHECSVASLDHLLVRYFYESIIAERRGSLYWNQAFQLFQCQDGRILLSLSYQWETLVGWLASEGLAGDLSDPRWLDESERQRYLNHILETIGKWTASHKVDELVELGQLMHFPWAKVAPISEVVANPQLNQRDFFVSAASTGTNKPFKFPGAPVKMSSSPWIVSPETPRSVNYNHKIYRDELGLSEKELATLEQQGVI